MQKKEVVAMLLAGGQGSRLGILTKKLAKPAVPFGGKYRIIDFTLSNCSNSGIESVGGLTQYQPLTLNSYIGIGSAWDLDRNTGGVSVLPPYVRDQGAEWYKGTANAVYQNMDFIAQHDPEYVLILSGDHIYKMDYSKMISYHKGKGAAVTIAVIPVPWEETHRFGVMKTDDDGRIIEFQEKPKIAKSNLASMGVYVFNWKELQLYLEADEADPNSSNDFGKNVIPAMLQGGEPMYAYAFREYWKDVGTIDSLWEANMDLIAKQPELRLNDSKWKIFSLNQTLPPQLVGPGADLQSTLLGDGCLILGKVHHSVIFTGTRIEEGAEVVDSVVMPGVHVGKGAVVHKAIIGENTIVEAGARIGVPAKPGEQVEISNESGITVIEDNVTVRSSMRIVRGTVLSVAAWPEFPEERIS